MRLADINGLLQSNNMKIVGFVFIAILVCILTYLSYEKGYDAGVLTSPAADYYREGYTKGFSAGFGAARDVDAIMNPNY